MDMYLKMAGHPYVPHAIPLTQMSTLPKGKIPVIEDDGKIIADSNFIISYLKRKYGDPLDAKLTPQERAVGTAFTRLLDENLYWVLTYARWVEPDAWAEYSKIVGAGLPDAERAAGLVGINNHFRSMLQGQGMSRHTRDEVYEIGRQDLQALSDFLGDRPYMLGKEVTSLDATAFGHLAHITEIPYDTPLKAHGRSFSNLVAYVDRIRKRYP
jgi:glutathione S-transferase